MKRMVPPLEICVVDDELGDRTSLHHAAFARAHRGLPFQFRYSAARSGASYSVEAALEAIANGARTDLVLLDLSFGGQGDLLGLAILRALRIRNPGLPVLILSARERDISLLGQCLEEGAIGFIEKTVAPALLKEAVERGLEMAHSHVLVGMSDAIRALRRQAARLSPYDQIPVLIVGERGTGKERLARHIHHNGPRRDRAFVPVNCAAVPEALFESEFFGATKGAYTGATARRIGYLERAHGGLLFLDEIGNMPLPAQAKLLRVLQDGTYRPVGSSEAETRANLQLVCATNVEPDELVSKGLLREDFYDRIAAVTIHTPSLRECRSDIPALAEHFLRQIGLAGKKRCSTEVLDALAAYDWPGNVRELQRALQEAVVRSEDDSILRVEHLSSGIRKGARRAAADTPAGEDGWLPSDPAEWSHARLVAELQMALEAKQRVQQYKRAKWKAEFMRLLYPHCKAANAKGFDDLVKRLTSGPWGDPGAPAHSVVKRLLDELLR